jgi:hypothetical protein
MLHHPRRPLLCWALVECCHMSSGQGTLPFHPPRRKFKKVAQGKKMLAPPAGLPPLLRGMGVTVGTLRTGYPHVPASSRVKGQSVHPRATTRPAALHPASLLRRAPSLSCVLCLHIPPPHQEGLRCCHTSCSIGAHLPAQEGTSTATRLVALDPASCQGGLWRCHASHGSLWALKKEMLTHNGHAARLTHY